MRFTNWVFALLMMMALSACAGSPKSPGAPGPVVVPAKKERFVRYVPKDWVLGYKNLKGNLLMVEHVPKGENVNEWTEILTFQTILGETNVDVVKFEKKMNAFWEKDCPGGIISKGIEVVQNGYVTVTWKQACTMNPKLGTPLVALFKAVAGNDNLYVIRKAWRRIPTPEEEKTWFGHFRNSTACDGRIPERGCSKVVEKLNQ